MLITIPALTLLTLSAFFSSVIAGMTGMGGGVFFLGVLASFVRSDRNQCFCRLESNCLYGYLTRV